jgi:hypothetical protein
MSIKDKSEKVLDEGMAKRATFQPPVDSAPLRAYQYWLKSSGREPFRENFCHFWRVVVIWAPLHFIGNTVVIPFFTSRPMRALGRGIAWVFTKPTKAWKSLDYDTQKKVEKTVAKALIGVLIALLLTLLVAMAVSVGIFNFLLGLTILVGIGATIVAFVALAEHLTRNSRAKREAERQRILGLPYDEWRVAMGLEKKPREPKWYDGPVAKVKAFFSAIGDYLVLFGNVVRVNKWKICPLVEIPNEVDNVQTV